MFADVQDMNVFWNLSNYVALLKVRKPLKCCFWAHLPYKENFNSIHNHIQTNYTNSLMTLQTGLGMEDLDLACHDFLLNTDEFIFLSKNHF